MSAQAFPLSWPDGFPRKTKRARAKYGAKHAAAYRGLLNELKLLGCPLSSVVISTNMPSRSDGVPYSAGVLMVDPGVAVYFQVKARRMVLACDKWDRIEDNVRAIEMSVAAMRGLERWGCSDIIERVFTGFAALPAPPVKPSTPRYWWEVIGCDRALPLEDIERKYRNAMLWEHPDVGGSNDRAAALNRAISEARAAKGAT